MDILDNAKAVRLRTHNGKYLVAEEDKESVTQSRNVSDNREIWTIERTSNNNIRFKSFCGKYLTASPKEFSVGEIGRKVIQSLPWSNSSVDWIPTSEGNRLKFETASNSCLRAGGGFPPWRNTVTHMTPHRSPINEVYLWEVDLLYTEVPTSNLRRGQPSAPRESLRNFRDAAGTVDAVVGVAGVLHEWNKEGDRDQTAGDAHDDRDQTAGDAEDEDEGEDEDE